MIGIVDFIKKMWNKWVLLVEGHNKIISKNKKVAKCDLWHVTDIFIPIVFGPAVASLINHFSFRTFSEGIYLSFIITIITYIVGIIVWKCENISHREETK